MAGEALLIVDDNPINLKLVKVLLTVEGYDIRTATNADEVMKLLPSFHPKLILMDIQLPGMDGLELTKRLKANPQYQDIIVVAITAYAMKDDKGKALAAGCEGYIAKPIDTNTLPEIIAGYLQPAKAEV